MFERAMFESCFIRGVTSWRSINCISARQPTYRPSWLTNLLVAPMTTTCPLAVTPSISESSVDTIEA